MLIAVLTLPSGGCSTSTPRPRPKPPTPVLKLLPPEIPKRLPRERVEAWKRARDPFVLRAYLAEAALAVAERDLWLEQLLELLRLEGYR